MYKIRGIALKTIELGYAQEAETMLRSLLVEQKKEMGLCHEDTLSTVVLLAYALKQMNNWKGIADLIDLIHLECWEKPYTMVTVNTIHELKSMLSVEQREAV